jgi:hypothetical protein
MLTRKFIALTVLAGSLLLGAAGSGASAAMRGKVFGVKPGMMIQSSYFGLEYPRLQPFVGVDWVGVAASSDDGDVSASIFIPHFGAKLFLKDYGAEKTIAPYLTGDWFFSLASVDADGVSSAEKDLIKDLLEFWGLGVGFGAEYFLSESFSVGGEYGLRYLHDKVDEHSETDTYAPGYGSTYKINNEFSLAFKVTYAVISANYHFGRKK